MGTTRRLKEYNPAITAISLQPDTPFHGLEGMKHMPTAIQPGIYDETLADDNFGIKTEDAYAMVMRLAREEGLLVGLSSGAALAGALQVAELAGWNPGNPATIVTVSSRTTGTSIFPARPTNRNSAQKQTGR
jgi:cysteine synthase B